MVAPIKKKSSGLPIKPTAKPDTMDMVKVSAYLVSQAQKCLLGPAPVIAALRAALDIYAQNAINRGFDVAAVAECEKLGQAVAKAVLGSSMMKNGKIEAPPLVDAQGNPIAVDEEEADEEVACG
jgi:hypothetical protein